MSSTCDAQAATSVQTPRQFFDLPPEIRNKIYSFVYQEILIYCTDKPDPRPNKNMKSRLNHVTPGYSLLLALRQMYNETKPYLNAAPISIAGDRDGALNVGDFPEEVRQCVYNLTSFDSWTYGKAFGFMRVSGDDWLDPTLLPNLREVWMAPNCTGGKYFRFPFRDWLQLVLSLLPKPGTSLEKHAVGRGGPVVVESLTTTDGGSQIAHTHSFSADRTMRASVEEMYNLLREENFVMKIPYKFEISGMDVSHRVESILGRDVLFQEWFELVVTWDSDGVRIDELPEVSERTWWKDPQGFMIYENLPDGQNCLELWSCEEPEKGKDPDAYRDRCSQIWAQLKW
ncbi:hypothetical protein H2200_002500 [Cladophialophora chaetospira]|uniref:Uncharacterized protein n=1 Tax=Cladophialophora chaetospira TaxID=386627 RepID=A0AA39CN41_9EURO|nr:hypothetical protein H2200_002500 [Cladophialophora chaetospira]